MNITAINTENPLEHWKYVDVFDKILIDFGCGRWEHVEYRDKSWPTTPEYFVQRGAKKVIGIDSDSNEINWFNQNYNNDSRYAFEVLAINSSENFKHIFEKYNPSSIKCDIEGNEVFLLDLDESIFKNIKSIYIETHSKSLFDKIKNKFTNLNYNISNLINLSHTGETCKVLFFEK
jgi:hypothetical protein